MTLLDVSKLILKVEYTLIFDLCTFCGGIDRTFQLMDT